MPTIHIFQSTPPVKAATRNTRDGECIPKFQSTPPVKAATCSIVFSRTPNLFQSTPPVKAATSFYFSGGVCPIFQSTPPVKAATQRFARTRKNKNISIHAAREGGDKDYIYYGTYGRISIHAAREGGDRCDGLRETDSRHFNPRRP